MNDDRLLKAVRRVKKHVSGRMGALRFGVKFE